MRKLELKQLIKEVIQDLNTPPTNWDKGWELPLQLRKGEEPFRIGEKWYLFVTDKRLKNGAGDVVAYDFGTDMIMDYNEFQKMIGN